MKGLPIKRSANKRLLQAFSWVTVGENKAAITCISAGGTIRILLSHRLESRDASKLTSSDLCVGAVCTQRHSVDWQLAGLEFDQAPHVT
jgi:hypothetical protein